ncbi:MAG: M20 family metallopeptidase [Spirochaetales bacterium]|nr:M20 family metallopeptidase [Spirochaetales bacterium]
MTIKEKIVSSLEKYRNELVALGRSIHRNPEIGGEEVFAADSICDFLSARGFRVTRGLGGLPTAFTAVFRQGSGKPYRIGFCAEYDALPGIGHACGHNLIGIASVAAALSLAESGLKESFEVTVIGTPDEEGTGGKIDLIKAGIFEGMDAAMMFHPGYETQIHMTSLACRTYYFTFHGRNAHAASDPTEGRNALDGVMLTFTNINFLRQYLRDDVRVHGIIKDGGRAGNVIPDLAVAEITIRSVDNNYLIEVEQRVMDCARGAALASGTEVNITPFGNFYEAMVSNKLMEEIFRESLDEAGFIDLSRHEEGLGSIDMGNVSRVVPAIHPSLSLTPLMVPGHTAEFSALCDTPEAYEVMMTAGMAMALTAVKIISDPAVQEGIRLEFSKTMSR